MSEATIHEIVIYESQEENDAQRDCFDKLCKTLTNIRITRYSIKKDRDVCMQNEDLCCLIYCAGIENLPATYVNGRIVKIEEYPNLKEINEWVSL